METVGKAVSALLIGYLLGAIHPAYIFAKCLKGIDLRAEGTGKVGTSNLKAQLGSLWPVAVTAVYDTGKGVASFWIAQALGLPLPLCYLGGVSAIVGHIFPFYLQFKGGEGAATACGLVLASLIGLWLKLPPTIGMADLAALAGFAGLSYWAVRRGDVIAVFLVPALAALSLIRFHHEPAALFAALILGFIFALALKAVIRHRAFPYLPEDVRWWRVLLRPAGFSFPLLSLWVTKQTLLSLIGSVLALFVLVDLARLSSSRVQSFFFKRLANSFKVYKDKERSRLSSMTLFLLGCFIAFLLFPLKVAFLAVTFLIFGDLTAKVFGFVGGKTRFFAKTLQGSLGYLGTCSLASYLIFAQGFAPFWLGFVGGAAASFVEALPFHVDDNLSVPLLSSTVMVLAQVLTG